MSAIPLNRHGKEHVAVPNAEVRVVGLMESARNLCPVPGGCVDPRELTKDLLSGRSRDKKRPPLAQGPSGHRREPMAGYAAAYIDGFDLYFGIREKGRRYLWLDLEGLVQSLLKPHQQLVAVRYFTARVRNDPPAEQRSADVPKRSSCPQQHAGHQTRPLPAKVQDLPLVPLLMV